MQGRSFSAAMTSDTMRCVHCWLVSYQYIPQGVTRRFGYRLRRPGQGILPSRWYTFPPGRVRTFTRAPWRACTGSTASTVYRRVASRCGAYLPICRRRFDISFSPFSLCSFQALGRLRSFVLVARSRGRKCEPSGTSPLLALRGRQLGTTVPRCGSAMSSSFTLSC